MMRQVLNKKSSLFSQTKYFGGSKRPSVKNDLEEYDVISVGANFASVV